MALKLVRSERGQAMTEYVLLIAFVVSAFMILTKGLSSMQITKKLMQPLQEGYSRTYQFGNPKTKEIDGRYEYHPRAGGGENFRLFINPKGGG